VRLLQHPADRSACSTSLEVCFPSAFAGRVAPSAAASLRTIPLRRSRPPRGPPEVGATARRIFVLAVLSPCVLRAPGPRRAMKSTIHTGPMRVIAPRSLFRAAFRYPSSSDPFTTGPDLLVRLRGPATLMGFLVPFAVFPGGGSPHFCGSSPLAVSRFAVARSPADFYRRPVAHLKLLPGLGRVFRCDRPLRRATPTGFWVVLPPPSRASALASTDRNYATIRRVCRARQSCHGLLWSSLGRVGCRFSGTSLCARARHRARSSQPQFAAALPFVGCHPLVGF